MQLGVSGECAAATRRPGQRLDVFWAWCALALVDLTLSARGLAGLSALVSRCPVRTGSRRGAEGIEAMASELCRAVDSARRHHPRHVECLPRSAALTCVIRLLAGKNAKVVIGVRRPPFAAHAWVEVDGVVVSDEPATVGRYQAIASF